MYARKYGKRFGRRKMVRRRVRKGGRKVSKVVKRYVKRAIHRQIENKKRIDYGANQTVVVGTTSTQCRNLLQQCGQGVDEYSRTGNQIKVVKGIMKMTVNLMPYNASSNPSPLPCWVKIWVVRDLGTTAQASYTPNMGKFFQVNGTSAGFQNNTLDTCLPVNKDQFRVLMTRSFKLGNSYAYSGGNPTNGGSYFDNSPSAKQITINWGKYCRKHLKFDDNNSPYLPINENLYYMIQAVPCDGSSVSAGQALIEHHFVNEMEYEDA